ncbi:MAG: diguanylate cyclase [Pseudomonadota bacterium]|nr:diguanylate cyclase [Pseudomonadota bacterium]
MIQFKQLKIKTKLIVVVLLTSTMGLLFTGVGVMAYDRMKQEEILAEEMSILARVIASRSAAALSFRDQPRAADNLSSLLVRESVVLACMYDMEQQVFARVGRDSAASLACPSPPRTPGEYFEQGFLDAYQAIELNGLGIGSVLVRTSLVDLDRRLQSQLVVSVGILGISLLMAFLLTQRVQKAIYEPIVDLGNVANKISEHSNFSIRATATSEDEIGDAIHAFNAMLAKIEADKEELTRLAYYDPLTQLANRRMFSERLVFALENARRSAERMGLIFLDLDKFKDINDELGHDIGDLLLKAVAKRLQAALPDNASAFRLGGDEFTVLMVGVTEVELERTAKAILDEFSEPLILAGKQLSISSSIGIAISDGNDNVSSIMKSADIALYQAKGSGRSNYKLYTGN